jgi:hypothetical protein
MDRIQGRLKYIERLLRAAHRFDTRAIATMAQVGSMFELVAGDIMELKTRVAQVNGPKKKK